MSKIVRIDFNWKIPTHVRHDYLGVVIHLATPVVTYKGAYAIYRLVTMGLGNSDLQAMVQDNQGRLTGKWNWLTSLDGNPRKNLIESHHDHVAATLEAIWSNRIDDL
jgi:hypothetical protein